VSLFLNHLLFTEFSFREALDVANPALKKLQSEKKFSLLRMFSSGRLERRLKGKTAFSYPDPSHLSRKIEGSGKP
jgi:hypothetical protein